MVTCVCSLSVLCSFRANKSEMEMGAGLVLWKTVNKVSDKGSVLCLVVYFQVHSL